MVHKITYTIGDDMRITPTAAQAAGVQGDDNAAQVEFTLPAVLRTGYDLRIEAIDSAGEYDSTDFLRVQSGKVVAPIPAEWTARGGETTLTLVASRDGETVHSFDAKLLFRSRQTAVGRMGAVMRDIITAALHKMTEIAQSAHESAEIAKQVRNALYVEDVDTGTMYLVKLQVMDGKSQIIAEEYKGE